ncbi:MAG: PEGA domain-containing protein [Candidatus Doudnabacteria bacterium]|nr:PEGA domain-containing protein [Candidatus Doudnabacteria bacterium]
MNKKTRYTILALGFLAFLILAPAIVLYVRGITYDFTKKAFVTTGVLAIRSEPKSAEIYLDGELKRDGDGDIRFLVPKEYDVSIKKSGYQTWNKRLEILSGQVTWGSPAYNKIFLLLENPSAKTISEGVSDFYSSKTKAIYLTKSTLQVSSAPDYTEITSFDLPASLDTITAVNTFDDGFVLSGKATTTQSYYFNLKAGKFTDLGKLIETTDQLQFDQTGALYALSSSTLFKIDPISQTKTAVLTKAKAFYFLDRNLYWVEQSGQDCLLKTGQASEQDSQTLLTLPCFEKGRLFVTFEKQIFLLADNNLYLANSSMERLADNVTEWNFDKNTSLLAILHSGQFDYYDSAGKSLNFVTRSGETLSNLNIKTAIGYAFYIKNGKLWAIELDARDHQNQYLLYPEGLIKKISLDADAKNILLLDNDKLTTINIR